MSVGIVIMPALPSPTFHSPNAIELLVPSMTSRMPTGGPAYPNGPSGGPPVWVRSNSRLDPHEAK
jgi:hypothetical protein